MRSVRIWAARTRGRMARLASGAFLAALFGGREAAATAHGGLPGLTAEAAVSPAPPSDFAERRVFVMGTTFDVTVRLPGRARALAATERAIAEVSRVEELLTTWREGGPLWRVNAAPAGEDVRLDPELGAVLDAVFEWSGRTRRAFDPTVLPLVRVWDIRGQGRIPPAAELEAARASTGTGHFRLDHSRATIARLDPRAGIDEGAWGKGYALDRAAERLHEAGAENALLDLGGQVLALGVEADGRPWTVAIAHPRERQRPVVRLAVPSGHSLSTSGDSERSLRVGTRSVGHLLDPRTGAPSPDFGSVSVLSPSALLADILSTAYFVLGPDDGLELSAVLRRQGVINEVLFLLDRGGKLQARVSPGFELLVLSVDPGVAAGLSSPSPQ
jgi:FAD:protein FMN transferase